MVYDVLGIVRVCTPLTFTRQPRGGGSYNLVQKEDQSFENRNNAALKVISFHCHL